MVITHRGGQRVVSNQYVLNYNSHITRAANMTGIAISVHIDNNVIPPSACIRDISYIDGLSGKT